MTVTTKNERETVRLAVRLAKTLRGGEVVGLVGELGSGKTTFARGLARALGIRGVVRSPTFTLMNVYRIKKIKNLKLIKSSPPKADPPLAEKLRYLIHVDAYRLKSARELAGIGIEEYLGRADTVTVIEWADRVRPILTKASRRVIITYSHTKNPYGRRITITRKYSKKA